MDIIEEIARARSSGRNFATVTIVKTEGSTPRTSGKMLVFDNAETIGTIGGGAVERAAANDALHCIRRNANDYIEYDLTAENEALGMTCGGNVSVLVEVFRTKPKLVMCGAGHVGAALVKAARFAGFDVTLIDDRDEKYISEAIAIADRFVHIDDFKSGVEGLDAGSGAYYVIATYGHSHDGEALEAALGKNAAYIGMIGSKNKVAALFEKLRAKGFTDDELNSIFTPIGLDIGSETPEEIALSIISEIMMIKKNGTGKHLRDCDHK